MYKPKAPFSPEQVKSLDEFQRTGFIHPFTCPNRGDGKHIENGIDLGGLIPTVRGWICQCCDYTQNWAHDFMLNGEAVKGGRPLMDEEDRELLAESMRDAAKPLPGERETFFIDKNWIGGMNLWNEFLAWNRQNKLVSVGSEYAVAQVLCKMIAQKFVERSLIPEGWHIWRTAHLIETFAVKSPEGHVAFVSETESNPLNVFAKLAKTLFASVPPTKLRSD